MSDSLLSPTDREEALSRAYASAIAAAAGYTTYPPADFDRDSIDIGFGAGGALRPQLHAQLKATVNLRGKGDVFKFSLKKKNYDDLKIATIVPRIVVILALPRNEVNWLNVTVSRLILRKCAYWASVVGKPDLPAGQNSATIDVPAANRFDVEGLKKLMEMARSGAVK